MQRHVPADLRSSVLAEACVVKRGHAAQAVVSEVFGLPLDWGADHQELRQLTRGAQQVRHRLWSCLSSAPASSAA